MEINELDSSAAEKYWNTVWVSYTRSGHLALFDAPYGILPVLQKNVTIDLMSYLGVTSACLRYARSSRMALGICVCG